MNPKAKKRAIPVRTAHIKHLPMYGRIFSPGDRFGGEPSAEIESSFCPAQPRSRNGSAMIPMRTQTGAMAIFLRVAFILEPCYFCIKFKTMAMEKTGRKDSLAKTVGQFKSLQTLSNKGKARLAQG
jgi:hypothetical protein